VLNLASLETQLKQTHGLGLFTKLALKNQIDGPLAELRTHHRGEATVSSRRCSPPRPNTAQRPNRRSVPGGMASQRAG
jgi:hypothetical protein